MSVNTKIVFDKYPLSGMIKGMDTISIYIESELKTRLEKIAEDEHRSLSSQITYIIEEWLEK